VRVLEVLSDLAGDARIPSRERSADVFVNGARVASITFGGKQHPTNPVTLDLSRYFVAGVNRVEVRENKRSGVATIQLIETHYSRWPEQMESAKALRFNVQFDKTDAAINEEVTARVVAERVGFRGYGMLLAEIGLPPGAEVDRATLDAAMKKNDWHLYRYEIQPDRIVAYLWPQAGGSSFEFKFRSRYGLNALTSASILYDYYNPDEHIVLKPTRFVVEAR